MQTLSKGQTLPSSMVFSSCYASCNPEMPVERLSHAHERVIDGKLVVCLMNVDKQSLKEL